MSKPISKPGSEWAMLSRFGFSPISTVNTKIVVSINILGKFKF